MKYNSIISRDILFWTWQRVLNLGGTQEMAANTIEIPLWEIAIPSLYYKKIPLTITIVGGNDS
jgi:hypothetical protein